MAANVIIPGKTIIVNTTGFITSDRVVIQGYLQAPTATTGHRIAIVERFSGKQIIGVRCGAGVSIWGGPIDRAFKGLSCTALSAGAQATIYLR